MTFQLSTDFKPKRRLFLSFITVSRNEQKKNREVWVIECVPSPHYTQQSLNLSFFMKFIQYYKQFIEWSVYYVIIQKSDSNRLKDALNCCVL